MGKSAQQKVAKKANDVDLSIYVPAQLSNLGDLQKNLPQIAKDVSLTLSIEAALSRIPTTHRIYLADSRNLDFLDSGTIQLAVTSPPYWTLKEYNDSHGQLGFIEDYEEFIGELDKVWEQCFRLLTPGGRLICIVGDVCLSRRKNKGRHTVVPLHASILDHCRNIGFDNLAPIIWSKISNASYEVEGGSSFFGKPYEPNAIIKNDIEFILMLRKPGGYRSASDAARILSIVSSENHNKWFRQIWSDLTGTSTREHPAPFPVDLAERLVRMFSFVGDKVLDPFMGTGTTCLAASKCGRNSIGIEVDPKYFDMAYKRLERETKSLFSEIDIFPFRPRD